MATFRFCIILIRLLQESVFVKQKIVKNRGVENALEHENVSNYFASNEIVLQLNVGDKVVKPLFTELWHSRHCEKVTWLLVSCQVGVLSEALCL
jgi:hypothetical protein